MITQRFKELGIALPETPAPIASYVPASRTRNLMFVSGQIPMVDGKLIATGKVPNEVDLETAKRCARQCVLNGLAAAADHLGKSGAAELDQITAVAHVCCYVSCDPSFTDHSLVANGASELLQDIFGERGKHSRIAVGAASLPMNSPVEISMILSIR